MVPWEKSEKSWIARNERPDFIVHFESETIPVWFAFIPVVSERSPL